MSQPIPTAPAIYSFYSPASDTIELPAVTAPQPIIVLPAAPRRPRLARVFRPVRRALPWVVAALCLAFLVAYSGHLFGNELTELATTGAVR